MRREHSEITDRVEIERILASTTIGRMATHGADGYPYITPVNFVFHEGNIYFHCALRGEKLDNIAANPKVCFEADIPLAYLDVKLNPEPSACRLHQLYHCVIIRGEAREVPDGPLKVAALNALAAKHEPDGGFNPVTEEMHGYKICRVIEIRPVSISAKSDLFQNKTVDRRTDLARYLKARNRPGDEETIRAMGFDPAEV